MWRISWLAADVTSQDGLWYVYLVGWLASQQACGLLAPSCGQIHMAFALTPPPPPPTLSRRSSYSPKSWRHTSFAVPKSCHSYNSTLTSQVLLLTVVSYRKEEVKVVSSDSLSGGVSRKSVGWFKIWEAGTKTDTDSQSNNQSVSQSYSTLIT
jgi:hypothetical protein